MKVFYLLKPFLLLFLVLATLTAQAQTSSLTGTVLDETGLPLPGASIQIKNINKSTMTDASGKYRLTGLPNGATTVTANYIGYTALTQQVTISGHTVLNLTLKPDAQNLNEVVVIGYGTQQKKDLTGSIATVSAKDFQKGAITSPDQLIQGKVAGVNVISNGGQPGGGSTIRIRGGASLNASNDPLVVIDGVPFSGNTVNNAPSPLSLINPNDIETFTILKDANATAIYGSRASNGVILITTKKGSSAEPVINFNTNNSFETIAKTVDVLSADQIRAYVNQYGNKSYDDNPDHTYKALLGNANTDWQKEIYKNAFSTDNTLSIGGIFKNVPYRVSAGYLDKQGLLITDKFERATGTFSIAPRLFTDHLKIDLSLKGSLSEARFANEAARASAIQFDPTQPLHADNQFGNYFEWIKGSVPNPNAPRNPVALAELRNNTGKTERSFGNARFDYSFHFLPELHANLNLGYDVSKGYGRIFVPAYAAQNASTQGFQGRSQDTQNNKIAEFYLNYAKDIASLKSRIDVTAGYGYYDNKSTGYNFEEYRADGTSVTRTPAFPFNVEREKLESFYGRLIYTYADNYILSATMRSDGSSRFGADHRWGYFPSVGFTWRVIGEDFMKESKVFSDMKLRLSYGQTGNKDGIGNYNYMAKYFRNTNQGQYQVGDALYDYYTPAAYEPDLKWETTSSYNVGLDYGFFKNRVYGSVDVYYKKTKDLLSTIDIPSGTNYNNRLLTNVGNMDVRGLEASINVLAIKTENTSWEIGMNMAYNKREVTNLTLDSDPNFKIDAGGITGGTGNNIKYNAIGQAPGSFFVKKQIYDASGMPLQGVYADLDGNGVVNADDKYFFHSPDPKFTFGFNSAFSYKKWTLSTVMRANIGNYVYDNVSSNFGVRSNILSPSGLINNANVDVYKTNFTNNEYLSDYYMKNASFLKMDNAGLAYDLGKISRNGNTTIRISANVQNVFVWTKYKGLDPEITSGIDYNLYPRPRTYTLGLNVGF
ncbi:SusC/RagA family TonB-linked outer membrane protein [Pedobacter gandavensis]|uniref:SusC/RagA family TonB-linked outer membrane protein n=1 Tax=Pedobacter gandavensis TaxID=2679963 RepID=A0ABR6EXA8_9SPHI|nr:TonB-dependent receptor [Pedobacter gandavensis]MBB2149611.1 SusC/RagA family TonB-linked outer membrane protein [Pedobacter gandavensis]